MFFLGHVVLGQGIAMDPEKIAKISNTIVLTTVDKLRLWIGLASYYRAHIQNFSDKTRTLQELANVTPAKF